MGEGEGRQPEQPRADRRHVDRQARRRLPLAVQVPAEVREFYLVQVAEVEVLVAEVKVPVEEQRVRVREILDLVACIYAVRDEREESHEEEKQRQQPSVKRALSAAYVVHSTGE